ncbi:uncharacterized protein TNCV_1263041 [Trichonephila clavipes]|nr:uncharacterized protein TNCV_1263041 [Trichonephila clavipes]
MVMSETHSEKRKFGKAGESSANKKARRDVSKKYGKFTEDCIPDGVFPIGDDVFLFESTYYDSVSVHIRRFKKYGKTYYPTPEGITLDPRWIEYIMRKKKVLESVEELPSGLFPPERHIEITRENFIDFTFKRIKYGPDKEITISREQWAEMIKKYGAIENAAIDNMFQCMDFLTAYKIFCESPIEKTLPSLDVSLGQQYLTQILKKSICSLLNEKGLKQPQTFAEELWGNREETFNSYVSSLEANEIADCFYNNLFENEHFLLLKPVHYVTQEFLKNLRLNIILREKDAYTLHKPVRHKFQRNRVFVSDIDRQFQADLVDMQSLAEFNKGYKYLLTCVDLFSKFAWAVPLKDKFGKSVKSGLEIIFKERKPKVLQTDAENKISHFKTQLPSPVCLNGEWEVGLSETIYPHSWLNVNETNNYFLYKAGDGNISSTVKRTIDVGCYETMLDIISAVQLALPKNPNRFTIIYNKATKRVKINAVQGNSLHLENLGELLGFKRNAITIGNMKSEFVADAWSNFSVFYVYSDLISPQIVGDTQAPLLRIVRTKGKDGETISQYYDRPQYLPLVRHSFQTIQSELRLNSGDFVPFERGQIGSGLTHYKGINFQKDYGIGGIFRRLFRAALPFLVKGGKTIGKEVLMTGSRVASDVLSGENFKEAVKTRSRESGKKLAQKAIDSSYRTVHRLRHASFYRKGCKRRRKQFNSPPQLENQSQCRRKTTQLVSRNETTQLNRKKQLNSGTRTKQLNRRKQLNSAAGMNNSTRKQERNNSTRQ